MSFTEWFNTEYHLAKPEWMTEHRVYMKEAWQAAQKENKETEPSTSDNNDSTPCNWCDNGSEGACDKCGPKWGYMSFQSNHGVRV